MLFVCICVCCSTNITTLSMCHCIIFLISLFSWFLIICLYTVISSILDDYTVSIISI